jgi:hypothetical protein
MTQQREVLLVAISELRTLFPDWRIGQLIANLTAAAGHEANIWEVEDIELLAAANRLIERNQSRVAVSV